MWRPRPGSNAKLRTCVDNKNNAGASADPIPHPRRKICRVYIKYALPIAIEVSPELGKKIRHLQAAIRYRGPLVAREKTHKVNCQDLEGVQKCIMILTSFSIVPLL